MQENRVIDTVVLDHNTVLSSLIIDTENSPTAPTAKAPYERGYGKGFRKENAVAVYHHPNPSSIMR
jgi:hypothetical protein